MRKAVLVLCLVAWASSASALSLDDFIDKGKHAVALARERGLVAAEPVFAAPENGFLDLAGPGLHVWATDAHGVIVFDLSGQTAPGTDISTWANDDGAVLMDVIAQHIDSPAGTLIQRFRACRTRRPTSFWMWIFGAGGCSRTRSSARRSGRMRNDGIGRPPPAARLWRPIRARPLTRRRCRRHEPGGAKSQIAAMTG